MNKVEIYIGSNSNYSLDVGDFDISFNYSFNDIRDITKRNGSYSKTLSLPGTKNNNFVLGGLFDINSDYSLFNPNIKVDAKVVVNSEVVMNGYLLLNSIDKLNNVDSQGNSIVYNVAIFSNNIDLLQALGEKTIGDLVSLSDYDHFFTQQNIEDSWQHTYEDAYVYPMYSSTQYPKTSLYTEIHFYPALFYKKVLDLIIQEAGFGWDGSFKNDNEQFEKEIIPYVGGVTEVLNESELAQRYVEVKTAANSVKSFGDANQAISYTLPNVPRVDFDTTVQDVSNQFQLNLDVLIAAFGITTSIEAVIDFDLQAFVFTDVSIDDPNDPCNVDITFEVVRVRLGSTSIIDTVTVTGILVPNVLITAQQPFFAAQQITITTPETTLILGDQVFIRTKAARSGSLYDKGNEQVDLKIRFKVNTNFKTNINTSVLNIGSNVPLANFFTGLKQKDLIIDLIKRYNLLISTSPLNPKTLIFETYNDYYTDNTEILDWTDKKDYSREDKIQFLTELQSKNTLFTYTPESDKDDLNNQYTSTTNETYGQYELIFDDNAKESFVEIKTPFSPTPSIEAFQGAYLPSISREEPKGRPRVLYYELKSLPSNVFWRLNSTPYNNYPYAGHFDDPLAPGLDLNFDTNPYYFYDGVLPTRNTQYNTYWAASINQIQEGRMLTAYFYLTEVDITKVKDRMSYKIWIKDAYYYVNRIIDYNPLRNTVTKVELLKVNELGVYADPGDVPVVTPDCPTDLYVAQQAAGSTVYYYYASVSGATVTQLCCTSLGGLWDSNTSTCFLRNEPIRRDQIGISGKIGLDTDFDSKLEVGENNILVGEYIELIDDGQGGIIQQVRKNNQFVLGNNNTLTRDNNLAIGDSNTIESSNVSIINSDSNIIQGENVTVLGVTNQTLTEPNSLYFGNAIRVNTLNGKYYVNGVEVDVAHKISRRITAAEIGELATTPIQLVPEVGTGKYPIIEDAAVYLGEGTLYDEDHLLQIYVDGAEHTYYEIENILTNGTPNGIYHLDYHLEKHPDKTPYTHTILNGGIFIKNDVDVTGGDLDIIVTVHYRIVDINNI